MGSLSGAADWFASLDRYIAAASITSLVNFLTALFVWRTSKGSQKQQFAFSKKLKEHEAHLDKENRIEELKFKGAYDAVLASQTDIENALAKFEKMLDKSIKKEVDDFLETFTITTTAYHEFSKQIRLLEHIALPRDRENLHEFDSQLLQMLMAMRFEENRRVNDPIFVKRVTDLKAQLQIIKQRLSIKYIRILRPEK